MFGKLLLQTNLGKTKEMMCTTGFIWGKLGVSAYKRSVMEEGATFREQKKIRVSYEECGTAMTVSSLRHHMGRAHRIVMPQT